MSIKEILQDYALQELERQIIMVFDGPFSKDHNYTDERSLLRVRRNIINHYMLQRQEELLLDIIAFNDALREALLTMYEKAHAVYEANKILGDNVIVEACCFLGKDYPVLHPVQSENRQELWDALQDSGWNVLYDSGVTHTFVLNQYADCSFDDFMLVSCPKANWNEGLDQELTKGLHLINAFHNLFDHTEFAITDFIYCREFYYEIKVEIDKEIPKSV